MYALYMCFSSVSLLCYFNFLFFIEQGLRGKEFSNLFVSLFACYNLKYILFVFVSNLGKCLMPQPSHRHFRESTRDNSEPRVQGSRSRSPAKKKTQDSSPAPYKNRSRDRERSPSKSRSPRVEEEEDIDEYGKDILNLHGDDVAYLLGKDGCNRRRLEKSSGCKVDVDKEFVEFTGI